MIERFRERAKRILTISGGIPIQVFIRTKKGILARFTNNGVHQNGFQDLFSYTLRCVGKKGSAWVESNDASERGMEQTVQRLRKARETKATSPSFSARRFKKGDYLRVKEYFPLLLEKTPEMAREAIEQAVRLIRSHQASANGYFSAYERAFYLADSHGLEAFHPATAVRFGTTLTKGEGKGYFSFYHPDSKRLDVSAVVEQAAEFAEGACRDEILVKPGDYECIFSPRALLELMEPLRRHFDANLCKDGKSVFSRLQGKQIFSPHFTLHEDLSHPQQFGVPFDAEGNPKKKVTLVEQGILKELLAEGHSTRGILEHPFYPQNLVVPGGELSRAELFKRIRRGIFINKIWYHTLVRESEMEVTGLATAGCLWIEQGRVRGRAVHLRYHDSLFSIFRSVAGVSKEQILLKDGERGAALLPYLWVSRLRVV